MVSFPAMVKRTATREIRIHEMTGGVIRRLATALGRLLIPAKQNRLLNVLQYCVLELCSNAVEAAGRRPVRVGLGVRGGRLEVEVCGDTRARPADWRNIQKQLAEGARPGGIRAALLGRKGGGVRTGVGIVSVMTILRKLGGSQNSLTYRKSKDGIVTARLCVRPPKSRKEGTSHGIRGGN